MVVAPGSTDDSRELIKSYGDDFIAVFAKNSGPSNVLTKGFSKVPGDIGYFLNSDDAFFAGLSRLCGRGI